MMRGPGATGEAARAIGAAMNLLLPGIASAYLIAFARVGTLIMLMPGIGEQAVSPRLRLAFACSPRWRCSRPCARCSAARRASPGRG